MQSAKSAVPSRKRCRVTSRARSDPSMSSEAENRLAWTRSVELSGIVPNEVAREDVGVEGWHGDGSAPGIHRVDLDTPALRRLEHASRVEDGPGLGANDDGAVGHDRPDEPGPCLRLDEGSDLGGNGRLSLGGDGRFSQGASLTNLSTAMLRGAPSFELTAQKCPAPATPSGRPRPHTSRNAAWRFTPRRKATATGTGGVAPAWPRRSSTARPPASPLRLVNRRCTGCAPMAR